MLNILERSASMKLLVKVCMDKNAQKGGHMATPNIVLTRIDNRLIHGLVGVTWVSSVGAN